MKNLKHLFTVLLLLCTTVATAHQFQVDGIYYNYTNYGEDKTVEVTWRGEYPESYSNEYTGDVVIPESVTYNGTTYSVTSIGWFAFSGCTGLTSIEIPNSVTSIGEYAFSYCESLTSVVIGNSVTSIGNYAFKDCTGLTNITIPNSVTSIGDNAFDTCRSLKELCIEDGTETLSLGCKKFYNNGETLYYGLFYDCPLETLYLGRNLSYSSDLSPFKQNETLTSVTIGNSVTSIGEYAFYYCSGLTSIEIPNSVTSIGYRAFYYCTGLTNITIPNSVISIGGRAFDGCTGLTSIEIPNSVTSIGYGAFYHCISLTSIEIPNSVTSIGDGAFNYCESLTNVVIGNSVTSIGEYAFNYCESLKKVEFRCAEIGTWFNGTSIEEVVIGNSVTSIIGGAFKNCSSLTNIHLLGKTPPSIVSNTFAESQYATLTIYVPQGALDAYQAADVWKDFWDIREEGTTETPEEEVKKCATPLITYNNSGLDITSETDGAEIHTDITCSDANSYNSDRIDLSATYNITAYATKSGYLNSETATATLCWIAVSGDSEDNSIIKVEAMPVLITCNNSTINICGGKEGAEVVVYTTSGVAVGNATITNGNATISTGLAKGEIAVISIAGKGIKVVMQ